jgi:hypothetical protein
MKDPKRKTMKKIPPYAPYKTFANFLGSLKDVPARIDRGLMRSMSGSMQAQLIAALEYLTLINPINGAATEKLAQLIRSEGAEREKHLKEIVTSSYAFIFKDSFDLSRATSQELQDEFVKQGTSGDTTRKCMAFFIAIAKAAGITLSPHFIKPRGWKPGTAKKGTKTRQLLRRWDDPAEGSLQSSPKMPMDHLLLSKFPSFDPNWPDEVKKAWFEAFRELRRDFKKAYPENDKTRNS